MTSVNWDKLNLACANKTWEDRWRQSLHVEVNISGQTETIKWSPAVSESIMSPVFRHTSGYSSYTYTDKVAPAPKPLDESWVTDYREAFDFIAKKRSYSQLEECGIVKLIEDWK